MEEKYIERLEYIIEKQSKIIESYEKQIKELKNLFQGEEPK